MKFLPEDRKRTIWSVALIAVFLGATVFVLRRNPGSAVPSIALPAGGEASVPADQKLLPYGSQVDLGVLQDEKFRILRPVVPLTVTPAELGKLELFGK